MQYTSKPNKLNLRNFLSGFRFNSYLAMYAGFVFFGLFANIKYSSITRPQSNCKESFKTWKCAFQLHQISDVTFIDTLFDRFFLYLNLINHASFGTCSGVE